MVDDTEHHLSDHLTLACTTPVVGNRSVTVPERLSSTT